MQKSDKKFEDTLFLFHPNLSHHQKVMESGDGLENLGIEVEVAAITIGQNVPFFEACKSMFDNNSAACKFGVSFLLGSR